MRVFRRFDEGDPDVAGKRALDVKLGDGSSQLVASSGQVLDPAILVSVDRVADLGHLAVRQK